MMRTHKRGLRLILLLLIASMLVDICPGMAETVSDPAATETEAPVLPSNPYRIVLIAPGGWTNNNGAEIKATVTDKENIGWQKIEYRMNGGVWTDCEDLFDQGKAEITVHENGTFMLRVTDPYDRTFDETAQVSTIDLAVPLVSANIANSVLHIDVRDELSGIAGVQINSMLFTTVEGNKLDVELDDNMNKFEKLAIRAFDFAGNFSDPITLDNPDYVKPVDPTPEPTATPKPSKKPGGSTSATDAPASAEPEPDPTPTAVVVPAATDKPHGLGSSLIYVSDEDWMEPTQAPTAEPTAEPTAAPTPEPIIQTEYITIGPGMPYQADSNSHTLDVLYSAATNKQFITLQSKAGNTFYLVIDYDKPIDEEAEMYETYFLNLVDERDLLALMSDEEKEEVPTPTPEIIYVTPEPTAVPAPMPVVTEPEPEKKPDQMTAIIALAAIVLLGGGGAIFMLKNKGKGGTPAIQKFYIDLQEKGLSPKYIKNIHGCLHKALDIAVRIDYITKNPTSACIIPRVIQKEMHPLDAPEQVQLLQSLKGKKNEALIVTALFTGMRAGELLGLTWDNVDFDHGVIHIVKQLTQSRGEGHPFAFGTLKNGKTRSINPAPFVLVTLKAHKEYQEEQKRIAGDLWNEGKFPNLVFTHADGSHLSQPTIWKAFQKALEDAGLNHHRLHDCRHTFAVNSIRAGDDIKTIQENMGHYSAAFTLDRYGHVTETMRQESANRMQAFIQGISGNGGGNA